VIKRAPTFGRLGVMVLFAFSSFGMMLYLWIAFGGASPFAAQGYRFTVDVPEATQLAAQSDVRISGVSVGKVVAVDSAPVGNRTRATIELRERYAPLPTDSRAILRLKSILGETYVELTPGTPSARKVADGGSLPPSAVDETVEIDEILRTFDPGTRAAWQTWMQSQAAAADGRGYDINQFFGQLPGWVEASTELFETLDAQSLAVQRTIDSTGQVFDALSERDGELSGLIVATNRLFSVTAQRNREFADIWRAFPRFERESTETLPQLTALANDADPAVRKLWPVATELGPLFAASRRLSPVFVEFFGVLPDVIEASERGVPAFEQFLEDLPPVFAAFQPWLRNVNPIVQYLSSFKREFASLLGNVVGASLGADGSEVLPGATGIVNYIRASQTLSPEALSFLPRPLGSSRTNAYVAPGGSERLPSGLAVLDANGCGFGDPAPPEASDPATLAPLVKRYAWRTDGRAVARPGCTAQGAFPGFGTTFPRLEPEP
jgi:phospholipid/cholesterol/gamma-HCH transport system substrate-binding protein